MRWGTLARLLGLILLAQTLVACGFHLRGVSPLPTKFNDIAIQTETPYTPLTQAIERALQQAHRRIVPATQARYTLHIVNAKFVQHHAHMPSNNYFTYTAYTYLLTFEVTDRQGHPVIERQTIRATEREQTTTTPLGGSRALALQKEALTKAVVIQLLERLNTL